jgi:hypothetical protein
MQENDKNREKHKAKARLLKALAEGGDANEKDTARRKYEEHLKKHRLTEGDIDSSANNRRFKIKNDDDSMILTNVILSVNPFTKLIHVGNVVDVNLDDEDYLEVREKFKFFVKLYRLEKEVFTMAFFSKHKQFFEPDEFTRNKWREKHSVNDELQKQQIKVDEINSKLSSKEEDESMQSIHKKLMRMRKISESLLDANYFRVHKTIAKRSKM